MIEPTAAQIRMPLVWSPWLRPMALLIGATANACWVGVGPDTVTVSFGFLGGPRIPRTDIAAVQPLRWRWWYGLGIRYYGRDAVGFVGRYRGIVEIRLDRPMAVKAVVRRKVRRIALSAADPDRLVVLLQS